MSELPRARLHGVSGALSAQASHLGRESVRRAKPVWVIFRGVLVGALLAAMVAWVIHKAFRPAEMPTMNVKDVSELGTLTR